jgi:starch phosphorylase
MSAPMQDLFRRHLGSAWMQHMADPSFAQSIRSFPDHELWKTRNDLRSRFIEVLRARWAQERLARGESTALVEAAVRGLRTDALTIGFARRVATYKRLYLLARQPERLRALLGNAERPVQLVIAGKAHPSDGEAKQVLHDVLQLRHDPHAGARFVFLEDYDLRFASTMVSGVDVWLNLPRFPMEASGTSGMKVAENGGLNLSVLDGWWEEACDGENGWGIRSIEGDWSAQDDHDAHLLFDFLEQQIVPQFYERGAGGIPPRWIARVKASMASLIWPFSSERMLREYVQRVYLAEASEDSICPSPFAPEPSYDVKDVQNGNATDSIKS